MLTVMTDLDHWRRGHPDLKALEMQMIWTTAMETDTETRAIVIMDKSVPLVRSAATRKILIMIALPLIRAASRYATKTTRMIVLPADQRTPDMKETIEQGSEVTQNHEDMPIPASSMMAGTKAGDQARHQARKWIPRQIVQILTVRKSKDNPHRQDATPKSIKMLHRMTSQNQLLWLTKPL